MDEVAARADAKAIADMKPFAVLNGANQTPAWSDELTAHGLMCLGNCSIAVPTSFIRDHAPYVFSYAPGSVTVLVACHGVAAYARMRSR